MAVETIKRLSACFALHLHQKHRRICWVFLSSSPCQHHCNHLPSETSASWAVFVGKNTLATAPQLIKLQICLFLAAAFKIVGSQLLQLQGWWDISKHLLSIYFESHIRSGVSFILSVTCHIRKLFYSQSNKGTAGSQKSPVTTRSESVIQMAWWGWGYVPRAWHLRRWSTWDQKSLSWCSSGPLWKRFLKKTSLTAGNVKMTRMRLICIQRKPQMNSKIREWTYFQSQTLCQVSDMAYTGIRVEDQVSSVNYIFRNIPTTLKLSFLFLFPPCPVSSQRRAMPVVTLNLERRVRLCRDK